MIMIRFGEDLSISTVTVSTALGHFGRGLFPYYFNPSYRKLCKFIREHKISIFSKSSTRDNRIGNFIVHKPWTWRYIRRLPNASMVNAYGLTNRGVRYTAEQIAKSRKLGFNVIPNFYPEFIRGQHYAIDDTLEAIGIFSNKFGTRRFIVEINYSCPNSREKISENVEMAAKCTGRVKEVFPNIVVVAKSSIVHPWEFYAMQEDAGADCIHAINTIPWDLLFDNESPLADAGGGGVSGTLAWNKSINYVAQVHNYTSLPIIFGCGITSPANAEICFDCEAKAISVCTWPLFKPKEVYDYFWEKATFDWLFK
jgi:dihydroorotate dehydrogenase